MMSCKYFALIYCNIRLNFLEIRLITCDAIFNQTLNKMKFRINEDCVALRFIQITVPALPRRLHLILLLLVICQERYFV